jgi:vacuolar-type H+-ATPase subunit C/Vma6
VTDWGDLVSRARGLSTHLLSPGQIRSLAECTDLAAFAALATAIGGIEPLADPRVADPHAIELTARRHSAEQLTVIARWARERITALAPLFDDEDRRAVRAVARGAVGGVPGAERTLGLVSTPSLPLRAIDELARAGDLATIGTLLTAWGHPFAAVVVDEGARQHVDLFRLEVALARAAADRARTSAGLADAAMRHFVRRTIDLENVAAGLVLANHHTDAAPSAVFVPGGAIVTPGDLAIAAESASVDAFAAHLAPRLRDAAPLRAALRPSARANDDAALSALIDEFRRRSLTEPSGLSAVIAFALRRRAELRALQQIIWRITLGVPYQSPSPLAEALP